MEPSPRPARAARRVVAWCLAFVALAVVPMAAEGHAELRSSSPAANSSLPGSPAEVVLTFTEAIDPATGAVALVDAQGVEIAGVGAPAAAAGNLELRASLPPLDPGVYTVQYSVVSAVDGHQTAGIFAFAVDPTGSNPPPAVPAQSTAPTADAAAVAARWLALGGGVTLVGIALFWLLSAGPALRGVADAPRPPYTALAAAAAAALVGTGVYLALAARGLGEGLHDAHARSGLPFDLAAPFGATPFANAMRVALLASLTALIIAAAAAIAADERRRRGEAAPDGSRRSLAAIAVAGLVLLAAFSAAGHASSLAGPLGAALDWLHLVGAAAWLGALPALLAIAVAGRRHGVRRLVLPPLRRHARVAVVAAPLVAITGVANTPAVIGPARDLVGTAYGNLVLGKALLFSLAVGIGTANWRLLRGRSARGVVTLLGAEIGAAMLLVLVAATMVTVAPAASRLPVAAPPGLGAAQLYGTAGDTTVHLAVVRPAPGEQRYEVVTRSAADGRARTDVQKVFLRFSAPPDSQLPEQRVELAPSEHPWLWATRGSYTPQVGPWTVEVVVRRAGVPDETVAFPLEVTAAEPPTTLPPLDNGAVAPAALVAAWALLPDGPAATALAGTILVAGIVLAAAPRLARSATARRAGAVLLVVGAVIGLVLVTRTVVDVANAAPVDVASLPNPVAPDEASLDRGAALYRANCSTCHGADGGGDGPAAGVPIGDLRSAVPRRSDGELAWIIERGMPGTRMPSFALTLTEQDRWDLINHLRATFDPTVTALPAPPEDR